MESSLLTFGSALLARAGISSLWEPAAPLNRTDADLDLVFIASNSIKYEMPTDDPIFSAHIVSPFSNFNIGGGNITFYESDYYLGVICCLEQHQVCHEDTCTPLSRLNEVFSNSSGLSMTQRGILKRLGSASVFSGISSAISGRSGTALRASETVFNHFQPSLPSNQWEIEISSWFSTGLATLQSGLRDYVSPTSNLLPGIDIATPQNAVDVAMCFNQKTLTTNGTVSFSVLGLAIILVVGTLLVITSFILETVVGWIGLKSHLNWVLDDKLQLQRMVFEGRGVRWNVDGALPVTEAGQRFPGVGGLAESQSLMARDDKVVGTNLTEIR